MRLVSTITCLSIDLPTLDLQIRELGTPATSQVLSDLWDRPSTDVSSAAMSCPGRLVHGPELKFGQAERCGHQTISQLVTLLNASHLGWLGCRKPAAKGEL